MSGVRALLATLLVVAAACGGGSGPDEAFDAAAPNSPILSLTMAGAVRGDDTIEQSARFGPEQDRVSAVVGVGAAEGDVLVTWYRVGADGDEQLFAHSVPVGAYDRAFSTAESPGRLAPGEYRVVAEVGGDSRELSWWVHADGAAATADPAEAEDLLAAAAAGGHTRGGSAGCRGQRHVATSGAGERR